jgi:hypothetical protein
MSIQIQFFDVVWWSMLNESKVKSQKLKMPVTETLLVSVTDVFNFCVIGFQFLRLPQSIWLKHLDFEFTL